MWGSGQPRWTSPSAGTGQQQQPPPMGGWSMDPNHYTQIPHNQVDWATLAQQWIQMKGTDVLQQPQQTGVTSHQNQAQQSHQSGSHHHQTPQNAQHHHQDVIGEAPMDLDESVGTTSIEPLYTRSSSTASPSPVLISNVQAHSPKSTMSPQAHVSHHHQHPPWQQAPFPSNEVAEFPRRSSSSSIQGGEAVLPYDADNYGYHTNWTHNTPPVNLGNFDRGKLLYHPGNLQQPERRHSYQEEDTYEEDFAEAARRKALPSWIREGLEKVEREKRKAEEKEKLAAIREEERRLRRKRDHQSDGTEVGLWGDDPPPPPPETFPTTAVPEKYSPEEGLSIKLKGSFRQPRPRQQSLQEILSSLTKEEQMEQVMLSVRRQLTKILLEVTNDEMRVVAQEALERAKAKKKGLGDYGSDSDDDQEPSDADEDEGPDDQNVDSDQELMAEIERKRRNYEMKNLAEENEEEELEPRPSNLPERPNTSRSRSKSGESGTNGKVQNVPPPVPVHVSKVVSAEPGRGEEMKVDEKKSERGGGRERRRSRSSSSRNRRGRSSSSSRKDKKKRDRSKSRDRGGRDRRSKSGSKKRDRHHGSDRHHRRHSRSSSSSSNHREDKQDKKRKRSSRSSSKSSRKDKKSHRRHHRSTSRRRSRSRDRNRRDRKSGRRARSGSSSSTNSSPRPSSARPQKRQERH